MSGTRLTRGACASTTSTLLIAAALGVGSGCASCIRDFTEPATVCVLLARYAVKPVPNRAIYTFQITMFGTRLACGACACATCTLLIAAALGVGSGCACRIYSFSAGVTISVLLTFQATRQVRVRVCRTSLACFPISCGKVSFRAILACSFVLERFVSS